MDQFGPVYKRISWKNYSPCCTSVYSALSFLRFLLSTASVRFIPIFLYILRAGFFVMLNLSLREFRKFFTRYLSIRLTRNSMHNNIQHLSLCLFTVFSYIWFCYFKNKSLIKAFSSCHLFETSFGFFLLFFLRQLSSGPSSKVGFVSFLAWSCAVLCACRGFLLFDKCNAT